MDLVNRVTRYLSYSLGRHFYCTQVLAKFSVNLADGNTTTLNMLST